MVFFSRCCWRCCDNIQEMRRRVMKVVVVPGVLENECVCADEGYEVTETVMEERGWLAEIPLDIYTRESNVGGHEHGYATRGSVSETVVYMMVYAKGATSFDAVLRRLLYERLRGLQDDFARVCSKNFSIKVLMNVLERTLRHMRNDGYLPKSWDPISVKVKFGDDDDLQSVWGERFDLSDFCDLPEGVSSLMRTSMDERVGFEFGYALMRLDDDVIFLSNC